jgi:hypothetical protein
MIKDHVTFSARAEKPRRVLLNLVALALGGCLSLVSYAAQGAEISGAGTRPAAAFEQIALPPIPYLDTMPWLSWQPATATMKVDTLLSPVLGPSGVRFDLTPMHRDRLLPAMS